MILYQEISPDLNDYGEFIFTIECSSKSQGFSIEK